jgi:uncharacterized repeat protein (TIGR02543 family)
MNSLIKKLALAIVAGVVIAAGLISPAQAATLSATVTATGSIGTSGTNAYPLTFTTTTIGSTANQYQIMMPTGWTFVSEPGFGSCSWLTVTGVTPNSCGGVNNGGIVLGFSSAIPSNTTITVEVPANTYNVAVARSFPLIFNNNSSGLVTVDSGTAVLAGGVSSSTVTFDGNGGTGTTASQTASSATALTANGFSRTGYTFAGWNTAANGSGTAYANIASYPFTSSATLYAQWTPVLANTGFDGVPYLFTGLALSLVGISTLLVTRRKASS